jgi:5'-nucleotidase
MTIADPIETVQNVMQDLNGKTDAVIVMAYTGDTEITDAIADIDGVSLVIESGQTEAGERETESGAVVVSAGKKGSAIGVASIEVHREMATVENTFYQAQDYDSLSSDEKTVQVLSEAIQTRNAAEAVQIGTIVMPEKEDTSDSSGPSETATGNLIADAMLDAVSTESVSAAWISDSSIHGELYSGTVNFGQIAALFDDDLYLVICKMTGGEIRSALENSFSGYPDAAGFLQISGMQYTYSVGTSIGSHLSDIMISDHTLDDARTYYIAMTNQMADELGFYSELSGRTGCNRSLASVVSTYIQKLSGQNAGTLSETDGESESADETVSEPRITITE